MRHGRCDTHLVLELTNMTYIEIGDWLRMQDAAQAVRTAVFVNEQGISAQDEWDADDATALHAVLFDVNGQALGNARLLQPSVSVSKVGRMAVLREARGLGYGSRLLRALLAEARRRGSKEVRLSAQRSAEHFYASHRFCVVGEAFDEVGIPHIAMIYSI